MLQPKRVKYRKAHRGRRKGIATRGHKVIFGEYAVKTLEAAWLTARQIEAARRAISHHVKRGGQTWIRVFPDKPVTTKPAETRQGGGKGSVDHWVAVVKPGHILFEVAGIKKETAIRALTLACHKLPIKTKLVGRTGEIVAVGATES